MTTNITPIEALEKIKELYNECNNKCFQCEKDCDSFTYPAGEKPYILQIIDQALAPQECEVMKCKYYRNKISNTVQIHENACFIGYMQRNWSNLSENELMDIYCKNNPNCYYKQLHSQEKKEVNNE